MIQDRVRIQRNPFKETRKYADCLIVLGWSLQTMYIYPWWETTLHLRPLWGIFADCFIFLRWSLQTTHILPIIRDHLAFKTTLRRGLFADYLISLGWSLQTIYILSPIKDHLLFKTSLRGGLFIEVPLYEPRCLSSTYQCHCCHLVGVRGGRKALHWLTTCWIGTTDHYLINSVNIA